MKGHVHRFCVKTLKTKVRSHRPKTIAGNPLWSTQLKNYPRYKTGSFPTTVQFSFRVPNMSTVFQRKLPTELQVMPFNLRAMTIVGLWENRQNFYRFMIALLWGTFVILVPKAILGIGSNRFDAIAKGIAEFLYECNLTVAVGIFVTKRNTFKQMVDLLTEIIGEGEFIAENHRRINDPSIFVLILVTEKDQPRNCYEEIRKQNLAIDKFAKFYAIYCSLGPVVFCIPSLITSYVRYYGANGNNSTELQFELPMEQRCSTSMMNTIKANN